MADGQERGADLPQRDAGGGRSSEPGRTGRTARSFADARTAGDQLGAEGVGGRVASETHRVDEASGTRNG